MQSKDFIMCILFSCSASIYYLVQCCALCTDTFFCFRTTHWQVRFTCHFCNVASKPWRTLFQHINIGQVHVEILWMLYVVIVSCIQQSGIFRVESVWRTWHRYDYSSHCFGVLFPSAALSPPRDSSWLFLCTHPLIVVFCVIIQCMLYPIFSSVWLCIDVASCFSCFPIALLGSSFSFPTVSWFWPLAACIRYENRLSSEEHVFTCFDPSWLERTSVSLSRYILTGWCSLVRTDV